MSSNRTVKALPVFVYRCPYLGDCTNGGISKDRYRLLLTCEDGFIDAEPDDPALLRLVKRKIGGREYIHAEPVNPGDTSGSVGPMFGGNYVSTSDSRFPSDYPIPLHDRYENPLQYNQLSH